MISDFKCDVEPKARHRQKIKTRQNAEPGAGGDYGASYFSQICTYSIESSLSHCNGVHSRNKQQPTPQLTTKGTRKSIFLLTVHLTIEFHSTRKTKRQRGLDNRRIYSTPTINILPGISVETMATAASALLSGQFDFNREIPERFSGFAPATECGFFYSESNQLTDFRPENTLSTQLFR